MESVFYQELGREGFYYEDYDILFPLHMHKQAEIFYLLEGQVRIAIYKREYMMQEGDILLVCPNVIHSYESIGHTRFYIGLVETQRLGDNGRVLLEKEPVIPINPVTRFSPELQHCMETLAAQNTKEQPFKRTERFFGYMNLIIDYLLEEIPVESVRNESHSEVLGQVINYIMARFRESLSLESVAAEIGINKYYLSKLFSEKIGYSFPDYIMRLRTEYAKEIICYTNKQMDVIACESGFQSESSFFRNFKKVTGMTPLQYRQKGYKR